MTVSTRSDAPTVIVTGLKRAGLNLLADMLREGGIPNEPFRFVGNNSAIAPGRADARPAAGPDCPFAFVRETVEKAEIVVASRGLCTAPDPHRIQYLPIHPKRRIGLWIERSAGGIIASIDKENHFEGRPPLDAFERRSIKTSLRYDFTRARDAAAAEFSPMFIFRHDDIVDEPLREANRLGRLLQQWWPHFNTRAASLAVRRIAHAPRPPRAKPHLKLVENFSGHFDELAKCEPTS